ncbi:MAG: 2-hydroxychromene-2-carboxylate isomerase [Halioglobus sp.]
MTTQPEVEFFYDCSSPWTYFAFTRIIPLTQRLNLPIRWRPILVGGVFNAVNRELYSARESMFNNPDSPRLKYYIKDMQDWARLCGVRAQMPAGHPINSVKAMRGACFAQERGALIPYSRAVFETYWGSDTPDIASEEVLAAICERVGLNTGEFFDAIASQPYKDLLRANTDELIARGGYGSPTIFVNGDDMYFGNDRLELVAYRLAQILEINQGP